MKNLIKLVCLFFIKTILVVKISYATTYFISTTGNDANPGTISQPFKTFQKLSSLTLNAGDIVYIRSGRYMSGANYNSPQYVARINNANGNSSNRVIIAAYPPDFSSGGRVILDCTDYNHTGTFFGIQISNSSYLLIKGIRVTGLPQNPNGNYTAGWWIEGNAGGNITLENCEADHIGHVGFRTDGSPNITYINCDAHHIDNPYNTGVQKHGGSDGWLRSGSDNSSTNTKWIGCRAWFCSDDGWDLFNSRGTATWENCWSFWNGYAQDIFPLTHTYNGDTWGDGNGFKMGGPESGNPGTITRFVNNCVAFDNFANGFDQNNGSFRAQFYNNTSYHNGSSDWKFGYNQPITHVFKNNIGYKCKLIAGANTTDDTYWDQSNNSWNGFTVKDADFASLNNAGVNGDRQADGSLPDLQFLHLSAGSQLIDNGIKLANLLFSGLMPDLGAFEYSDVSAPSNQSPVADAGADQTITLPINSVTLNGSNSKDSDGSIASYTWEKTSGPSQGTITNTANATTTVTGLTQGTYVFKLTVKDNGGAAASDAITIIVNAAPNQPPVADAGINQTISLPTNSVTLDGSNSKDPDGSIVSYTWEKVSGPSQNTITSAANATTTVTGLAQGTYVFKLTVKDNGGAAASDAITITVNAAPNQSPVVDAGADQTITLPTNSVTLNGSNSKDPDGSIVSYTWEKTSGPSQSTIANTTSATTTVTNLTQGTYVFKLTVKDNGGAAASDAITIIVNAAPNQPPVADAGADQTITLPTNSVTLNGSNSKDPDGSIASYIWEKTSGPSQGTITNTANATTTVTDLTQGTYVFKLAVKDNGGAAASDAITITVNTAPNQPPVADAGADQTITLPTNSVTLDGSNSKDSDGTITSYTWEKTSGPAQGTITSSNNITTTATNLVQGTYIFKLTIKDNRDAAASDYVTITVNAAPNQPPVADAGVNQTITLPTNSVTLNGGNSKDPDGSIVSYTWSKTSGPSQGTITNSSNITTTVTNLVQGTYVFKLTVEDNKEAVSSDYVTITVNAAPNQSPVADAGINQTISLPTNSVTLNGSNSKDPDGSIVSYTWEKASGPSQGTITNTTSATTTVTNLVQGTYVFKLTVKDNEGIAAFDSVIITVKAAPNQPPTADAGTDQTITLPINSVTLDGSNSKDPDGSIASYTWEKTSGPSQGTITSSNNITTTVTNLVQGTYIFKLTIKDNRDAAASEYVTITVNAAPNQLPVADAGADQTITLPINSVTLNGSNSKDPDGSIVSYTWSKTSGPAQGTITNTTSATTTANNLVQGTYVFKLTVKDNEGIAASEYVTITVNAAPNQPPVADAGADQTITLPTNSVTLNGSNSKDPDGSIASYTWEKTSGPSQGTITNTTSATTTVTNLVQGTYVFKLTVKDNRDAAASEYVTIIVNAAPNQPPVADAGANQTITLPTNSVTLNGSNSKDPDGSIVSYTWSKTSGPAQSTITNTTSATTTVTNLTQGTYVFKLTVKDNEGIAASDSVIITVKAAPNQPPVADAGVNQTITLPTNSVTLNGSNSKDPDGSIASNIWEKVSGPSQGTIANTTNAVTTVTDLAQGTYVFKLTVKDNGGAAASDSVIITVKAEPNQPPVADAGVNQTITLPTNSVTLDGSNSKDPDGMIVYHNWIKKTGPSAVIISNVNTATPTISGLEPGQYIFELTVTDNKGALASDSVIIIVNAAPDQPPVAEAGKNITIISPESTAILDGSESESYDKQDSLSYIWEQVKGPALSTISSATSSKITVGDLKVGEYVFKLTVINKSGLKTSDEVKITVLNAKIAVQADLYPNPAMDIVNIKIAGDSIETVVLNIYDLNGRVVKRAELNKQIIYTLRSRIQQPVNGPANNPANYFIVPVNIAQLSGGIYVVEIINGRERISVKLVKY